jgi:anti-sigma regulatory factor (Ser/Thr protein kinase)
MLCSSLEDIRPTSETVRSLVALELGEERAGDVELALVEAVTNVVRHGYGRMAARSASKLARSPMA